MPETDKAANARGNEQRRVARELDARFGSEITPFILDFVSAPDDILVKEAISLGEVMSRYPLTPSEEHAVLLIASSMRARAIQEGKA